MSLNLPLFPLPSTILLPGVVLPLHFFEPRYVQMIEDVIDQSPQQLVMSQLLCKDEVDYYLNPPFQEIGCIGEVVSHEVKDNGTHDILLVGLERATLVEEKSSDKRPYRCVKASPLPYPEVSEEKQDWLKGHENDITGLLSKSGQGKAVQQVFDKWHDQYLSTRALIHIFIHALVRDAAQLQEILESDDVEAPLDIIRCWLEQDD